MKRLFVLLALGLVVGVGLFVRRKPSHDHGSTAAAAVSGATPAALPPAGRDRVPPPASLSGRVTDEVGAPIATANVCVASPKIDRGRPTCTSADEAGRYHLALTPGTYELSAAAEGFLAAKWYDTSTDREVIALAPASAREHVDVVLARGGVEVKGQVKDVAGGAIAHALVVVSNPESGDTVTHSDDQGVFRTWSVAGEVIARASADGYAEGHAFGIAPGHHLVVSLTPESVLEGIVVEAGTGTPIAGANVTTEAATTTSDADGHFRLWGLEPGRYKPEASSGDRWGSARGSVTLGLAETATDVVIELAATLSASGRVVLGSAGCAGAEVSLSEEGALANVRSGEADERGDVRIGGLVAGTYEVGVHCPNAASAERYEPIVLTDRSRTGLVWTVSAGFRVRGMVTDTDGRPLAGASLLARPSERGDPRGRIDFGDATSQKDGTFALRGLAGGSYSIDAQHRAAVTPEAGLEVDVTHDLDDVKIVLSSGGKIGGVLLEDQGAPLGNVRVKATSETETRATLSRDDGTFLLEGVRPGAWSVATGPAEHAPPGNEDGASHRVTVKRGETANVKLIVAARRGEIQGRVVDPEGAALADAFVEVGLSSPHERAGEARRRMEWTHDREPVLTDTEGQFTIGKLAPGTYTVRAHRKGGGEAVLEGVALGARVTLTIASVGMIGGSVVGSSGGAPERFVVTVRDDKTSWSRSESFFRSGGAFAIRDVPAGTYRITAEAAEARGTFDVALGQGERRTAITIALERYARVRGRLVALEDGKPIPAMMVFSYVRGMPGGIPVSDDRSYMTDAEGRFEIARVAPGQSVLGVMPKSFGDSAWAPVSTPITVPGGTDTELPPIRVPRLRSRGNGGDLGFAVREEADGARHVVTFVRPGALAANGGMQVGDEIVSIDGYSVEGPNGYLYEALVKVLSGTKLAVGLRRGPTIPVVASP